METILEMLKKDGKDTDGFIAMQTMRYKIITTTA